MSIDCECMGWAREAGDMLEPHHPRCPHYAKALRTEVERLKAFRDAVAGWRENDWPEWFCRRTAEAIADLGRAALGREK